MNTVWRSAFLFLPLLALPFSAGCLTGWVSEHSGTDQDLYGVFGVDSDVFAVGAKGTVLHKKGGGWGKLNSGTEKDLYGVWGTAADHVVVVGASCTALEYGGDVAPPADGGVKPPDLNILPVSNCTDENFSGIDGHAAAWALVGSSKQLRNYDGNRIGAPIGIGSNVQGICYPIDGTALAVGDQGAYIEWNGTKWLQSQITICGVDLVNGQCPVDPMFPVLWGVWVGSEGEGAVVGMYGGVWKIPKPAGGWTALPIGVDSELHGVHGWVDDKATVDKTELFVVGAYGATIRIRGDKIERMAIGTNAQLNGVWVSPDGGNIYVVGARGTIVHLAR